MTKSKILSTTNAHMQLPTEKDLAKRVRERHTRQENSQDGLDYLKNWVEWLEASYQKLDLICCVYNSNYPVVTT